MMQQDPLSGGRQAARPLTWASSLAAGTLSPAFLAVSLKPATKGTAGTQLKFPFLFFLRHSAYQHRGHSITASALLSVIPEASAGSASTPSSLQHWF